MIPDAPRPAPGEGAQVAWTGELPGGRRAVLYSMQVRNPRPDVTIETLDVELAKDAQGRPVDRAVPALLAVTLGTVMEE